MADVQTIKASERFKALSRDGQVMVLTRMKILRCFKSFIDLARQFDSHDGYFFLEIWFRLVFFFRFFPQRADRTDLRRLLLKVLEYLVVVLWPRSSPVQMGKIVKKILRLAG